MSSESGPQHSSSAKFARVMDLPDETEDLDLTLRDVSRRFPEQLARALLPPGTAITSASWMDTQLTSRQRRMDRGLEVVADGERRVEHNEWQLEMEADTPLRVYEYHTLTSLALAVETPPGKKAPRVRSTLVLLSGREKRWPAEGEYRTSPDDAPFSGVTFRIDAVYQRTVAELEARGSPLWMIFAPLAVDADPGRMEQVLGKLRAESSRQDFGELAAALTVVAAKDKRQRGLRECILRLVKVEDVMESSVYKMGRQQGQREDFARQYGKRLGRSLSAEERATLAQRLATLGADRLDDVLFGLSPEAITAWLGDPSAI
jgi:hypothetical protein